MSQSTSRGNPFGGDSRTLPQLRRELGDVFDACTPNQNDEVVRGSLINALVETYRIQNDNEEGAEQLREQFSSMLTTRSSDTITRSEFFRLVLLQYDIVLGPEKCEASPASIAFLEQRLARLEEDNGRLYEELRRASQREVEMQLVVHEHSEAVQHANNRIEELEEEVQIRDHRILDLMIALSTSQERCDDQDVLLSELSANLRMFAQHRASLEEDLTRKTLEVEEILVESRELLRRVDQLTLEKQELQCELAAERDARNRNVMELPSDDSDPSPDRSGLTTDSPPDGNLTIAEEFNLSGFFPEFCRRCVELETSDVATDVGGLIETRNAVTCVDGLIETRSFATDTEPMETVITRHASSQAGHSAAATEAGLQTDRPIIQDVGSQTDHQLSRRTKDSSRHPEESGRLGVIMKWTVIIFGLFYFTWFLSKQGLDHYSPTFWRQLMGQNWPQHPNFE